MKDIPTCRFDRPEVNAIAQPRMFFSSRFCHVVRRLDKCDTLSYGLWFLHIFCKLMGTPKISHMLSFAFGLNFGTIRLNVFFNNQIICSLETTATKTTTAVIVTTEVELSCMSSLSNFFLATSRNASHYGMWALCRYFTFISNAMTSYKFHSTANLVSKSQPRCIERRECQRLKPDGWCHQSTLLAFILHWFVLALLKRYEKVTDDERTYRYRMYQNTTPIGTFTAHLQCQSHKTVLLYS